MGEQQQVTTSACPHPEAVGTRWGDPISEERQTELQGYLDRWAAETDHGERKGPFESSAFTLDPQEDVWLQISRLRQGKQTHLSLTGADVSWLAEQSRRDGIAGAPNLHLERADLHGAHLEGAILRHAHLEETLFGEGHLEGANFMAASLERANFTQAHLEGANLWGAHLEGAYFRWARVKRAKFAEAHLEGAYLGDTDLEGADLSLAHLEDANLSGSHLEDVNLSGSHLEDANLSGSHLEGADLSRAWLDGKTMLSIATFDVKTRLGDMQWSGVGVVNLTQTNWGKTPRLGDERGVSLRADVWKHEAAVRAYRQVATQLRAQGMNDFADRYLYRAQVLQRRLLLRRFRVPQYLGSLFLDLVSGYGYRPVRSLIAYILVILGFAAAYFALGGANGQTLSWNEALVISMTAFHGRGFFSAVFQPGDLQAAVAAVEAFIGLLIEIVLIATFTQRFFAR
jgi:uncharacterized protein YjbI with pentapeptide repeats